MKVAALVKVAALILWCALTLPLFLRTVELAMTP